jgi:hypothetical protein
MVPMGVPFIYRNSAFVIKHEFSRFICSILLKFLKCRSKTNQSSFQCIKDAAPESIDHSKRLPYRIKELP